MLLTGSLETVLVAMARTVTHGPRSVKATGSSPRPCLPHPDQYIYAVKRGGKFLTRSAFPGVQEPAHGAWFGGPERSAFATREGCRRSPAMRRALGMAGLLAMNTLLAAVSSPPPAADDPILALLAEEDYEQSRPGILETLRLRGGSPCDTLAAYAGSRNGRVREHAVRALADAECSAFASYRSYVEDSDAWVTDAVIEATRRYLMPDAVPFLLAHVSDPRRILAEQGTRRLGDSAHRALQQITGQSFHYDPAGTEDDRRNALSRWRQWYVEHRTEPRDEWLKEGIARAREYAGRDYAPHRLEGLRLLALIGEPALADLRALIRRAPGDVQADLTCQSDEPPRPTDRVPCHLLVRDASTRHVVIAPPAAGPVVRVGRIDAPAQQGASDEVPRPADTTTGGRRAALASALAEQMIDLTPGEVRRYDFTVGPVPSAGRYRVRATLADLAAEIVADAESRAPAAASTPPAARSAERRGTSKSTRSGKPTAAPEIPRTSPTRIEAETIVRFDQ